ncbi:MAG: hypothetical protein U9O89_00335 [Thermoproteota archaeon]|nr:hypothetical protein [Thermoproteota archaeon]
MKLTKRMKKILIFLLHPEKYLEWFHKNKIETLNEYSTTGEELYVWDVHIAAFLENRPTGFSSNERFSYRRTFQILKRLGLVERYVEETGVVAAKYKLTNEGRKMAEKIEKEIKAFIKEYENIVS